MKEIFLQRKIFLRKDFLKKNFCKYFSFKRWIFKKKKRWKSFQNEKSFEKKNSKRRWKLIHKAKIYPKFWADSKNFQIKRAQDHEYTIDFGGRHWAIKP